MDAERELVTVYRSMDEDAEEQCDAIRALLEGEGVHAHLVDDSAPGVPEGTFEVRVPSADAKRAEQLIAQSAADEPGEGDPSSNLDLETVFEMQGGATSELQAMGVKNLLESNGIPAVVVGDSVLPNLPFEIKVPREQAALARELIAEIEENEGNE